MARIVNDSDRLSRYLFNKGDFSRPVGKAKPRAFERPPKDNDLSMFHTEGLDEPNVWTLGASTRADQTLKARADLRADDVATAGLTIDPNDDPPRHVSILGWPSSEEDELQVRVRLADAATLVLRPTA
jgi:hypothetical protein